MSQFKQNIFKTNVVDEVVPPSTSFVYFSGTSACISGILNINSPINRGFLYYSGALIISTILYSDIYLTVPVTYTYIRLESSPRRFIYLDGSGEIIDIYTEGDPC